MNEKKMKSAIELALEKTERHGQQARAEQVPLTEEMKGNISKIEKEYDAKIAEKDVMLQSKIKIVYESVNPTEAQQLAERLQTEFREEKKSLLDEKSAKIEKIKKQAVKKQ